MNLLSYLPSHEYLNLLANYTDFIFSSIITAIFANAVVLP